MSFRPGKVGRPGLEARHSDPLDPVDSGDAASSFDWDREPILNLVAAVLGCGVLGFPFCFKTCGLGLAALLVLVTLAAAELSMRLLLAAAQLTGTRSYEELARHTHGRGGQLAVDACVLAMNLGSLVAYLNILTDTVSTVAGTVIPPGAEPSRTAMLWAVTAAGCLPVALFVRSARLLTAVSSLSMAFLLSFCVVVALLPFSPTPNTGPLLWWRWEGVLVAFPIVSYGFTAHQYLFQIYPPGQRPSMRRMTAVVQRGMLLAAAIYVAVGAGGYTAFGARTAGDVLRNFGGGGARGLRLAAERALKFGFGLSLLGTIPLTVLPLHTTCAPWLALCSPAYAAARKQAEAGGAGAAAVQLTRGQEQALTTSVLGASCALAVLLPNVEFVFGLAGSTASTLMAFILPAAIFLAASGGQRGGRGLAADGARGSGAWRRRRRLAGALLAFGCASGVLCTHALLLSIREEAEVVALAQELAREEGVAAAAAAAEQTAKQVAEAVATVAAAAQEVQAAQAEASGQAETLAAAAAALNETSGGRAGRVQRKRAASSGLAAVHSGVDRAVAKLENVTAALGATASRMRNETSGGGGGQAAAQAAGARPSPAASDQPHGAGAANVTSSGSGSGSGDEAHRAADEGAEAAAAAGAADAEQAARAQAPPAPAGKERGGGGDGGGVAEALEKVASSANETLAAVKQSKAALEAAAAEAATGAKTQAKAVQLGKAISQALNATAAAAARLNATTQALRDVEQQKTGELVSLVARMAADDAEEERQEAARQAHTQHHLGRKEGLGTADAAAAADAASLRAGGEGGAAAGGNASSAAGRPRGEVREALKQVAERAASSASSGGAVNVSEVAAAAIEAASSVLASSKGKAEQSIERKGAQVAVRAIEIAKELHSKRATSGSGAGNGTASEGGGGAGAIEAAAVKHEELVRQSKQQGNSTAAAPPPPVRPASGSGDGAGTT